MAIPQTITLADSNGPPAPDEESHLLGSVPPVPHNDDQIQVPSCIGGEATHNGPTVKPMMNLEAGRRRNMIWSISLLVVFFSMFGVLAVWRFQQQKKHAPVYIGNRADHARDVLNEHFHSQSKVMAAGCDATILIMRHCEKVGPNVIDKDGNAHCSYLGVERSKYIQTLFGNDSATARWPQPSYMFALTADRGSHWNFREYETLLPLSRESGVAVNMVDQHELPAKLFDLLRTGALCGRLAVVSWKHELIHDLATSLGCGPDEGCPLYYPDSSFDEVWQLKYIFRPPLALSIKDESTIERQKRKQPDETPDATPSTPAPTERQKQKQPDKTTDATPSSPAPIERQKHKQPDKATDASPAPIARQKHKHPDKATDATPTSPAPIIDANTDDDGPAHGNVRNRHLRKGKRQSNDSWFIFGFVQNQNFDPLAFSFKVGDYNPEQGVPSGGRWNDEI